MEYMKVPYKSTDIFIMTSSLEKIVTVVSLLDSFSRKHFVVCIVPPFVQDYRCIVKNVNT